MTGLAMVIRDHAQALEYDLMTRTGRTLSEYGGMGAAGMVALVSFLKFMPPDAMTYRAMHPHDELGAWNTQVKTNAILADIFDVYVAPHARKGRKPQPYPRPSKNARTYGKGAIAVSDFDEWWNSKG